MPALFEGLLMATATRAWQAPTREDLLAAARRRFVRGEPVDLPAVAAELGVSRATAYRWGGNNDQLVAEIVAQLVDATFERLREETRGKRGAARVVDTFERGLRYMAGFAPLREFLERDPQKGLRLIASKDAPVQQRTIAQQQRLLEEEIGRRQLTLAVDPHTMAYAITRLGESFLYADLIAGEQPDVGKAVAILRLMLGLKPR
jgi:AcrR family transcriptional regulator